MDEKIYRPSYFKQFMLFLWVSLFFMVRLVFGIAIFTVLVRLLHVHILIVREWRMVYAALLPISLIFGFYSVYYKNNFRVTVKSDSLEIKQAFKESKTLRYYNHEFYFTADSDEAELANAYFKKYYIRIKDCKGYVKEFSSYAFSKKDFEELKQTVHNCILVRGI